MSQDTRKDPRAKVLTMTVRYKSATLDEFIEHHSYDVSRGGMFIKTPSPFPPGTLLKFEVKIAADQKVIQGVGRVVWKRDSESAPDVRPAGMGVKFIKIDDASRKVIDTLVESRGDASSAYEAGGGDTGVIAPGAAGAGAVAATAAKAPSMRKATMIGLGAMNPSARPQVSTSVEKPVASFFPETNSEADMPAPEDRTVMKQAAELLQDAMRGAGSSMADAASSSKYDEPPAKSALFKAAESEATPIASAKVSEPPIHAPLSEPQPAAAKPASKRPAAAKWENPAPATPAPKGPVTTSKSTIPAARKGVPAAAAAHRRTSVPAVAPAASSGGSGGRIVVITLVIAATAGLVYALSNGNPPAPKPVASAEPPPTPAPVASEAPPVAADTASAVASASAAPVESAAPPASASAVVPIVPVAPAAPVAPPVLKAPVVAAPRPAQTYRPAKPKPVAPSEPSAPEPSAPTEPSVDKPTAPSAPAAPSEPAPKPKPVEPAGDNPY